MTASAVHVTGLRKASGEDVVLDGIDLEVATGTIFALLGPNGAGKTTTIKILSTLIGADGGEIRVASHDPDRDPDRVRAAIGVTGQFSAVDKLLTGEENLTLMADLHHPACSEGRRRVRLGSGLVPTNSMQAAASLVRRQSAFHTGHERLARPADGDPHR